MSECPICLDNLEKPVKLNCNHSFCYKCIIQCSNNCPLCRTEILNKNDIDIEECCKCTINNKIHFYCNQYTKKGKCRICRKKSINFLKKEYFLTKIKNIYSVS